MRNFLLPVLAVTLILTFTASKYQAEFAELQTLPPNLSFQADIYGDSSLETIEYLSDLRFYSFGGFGVNAHIYRARLRSGDEVAYAISASTPNAFSFDVISPDGIRSTLAVTSDNYPQGTVEALSSTELHFVWDINQSGMHLKLHRYATLVPNEKVTVGNVIQERFVIENLGPTIRLMSFSEHLHMDDRARVHDYNNDGRYETLLAINSFTTDGYPVFGKVYLNQEEIDAELISDGVYATVTHNLYRTISSGSRHNMTWAAYVSSTARNNGDAERQVARDAAILLGLDYLPDQWYVRTYNTDDASGVFVNGVIVAGSRYSSYPDSGWSSVSRYWRNQEDNFVSFASYDMGICCSSTWGFSLKRNNDVLWDFQSSGPISKGIVYQHILKVSSTGDTIDYEPPSPSPIIDGNWYVLTRAKGGMSFVLVGDLPVAGSVHDQTQWVDITNLLGQFDNHVHFNAWNDGDTSSEWYLAIRNGDQVVWENQIQASDGSRGRVHHIELIIDKEGHVYPKLDLPVDYEDRTRGSTRDFNAAFNIRTTSMFDHRYPTYGKDNIFVPYTGDERPDPEDVLCTFGYNCYDGHPGYDLDDICPPQAGCINPLAVYPAADGVILESETGWIHDALGCQIAIDHGNHWKTIYAHLEDPEEDRNCEGILRDSGTVTRFDLIGLIGCSGTGCTAPPGQSEPTHLHFEVRENGRAVDPAGWDPPNVTDWWAVHPDGAVSFPQWLNRHRIQQVVDVSIGGELTSMADEIQITVPSGYYSAALTFSLSSVPIADPNKRLVNSGISFSLTASEDSGNSVRQLNETLKIRIDFDIRNIAAQKLDTVSIYTWDDTTNEWLVIPTSVDFEDLIATAQVNHLSVFALMGEPLEKVYLPLVMHSH